MPRLIIEVAFLTQNISLAKLALFIKTIRSGVVDGFCYRKATSTSMRTWDLKCRLSECLVNLI